MSPRGVIDWRGVEDETETDGWGVEEDAAVEEERGGETIGEGEGSVGAEVDGAGGYAVAAVEEEEEAYCCSGCGGDIRELDAEM